MYGRTFEDRTDVRRSDRRSEIGQTFEGTDSRGRSTHPRYKRGGTDDDEVAGNGSAAGGDGTAHGAGVGL